MQSRYAPGICISSVFHMLRRSIWKTPASLIMNLKQTLAPTLISFAMCSNMLCNRMDLSAGAVVMLSAMFGAKMVYLYGIGLIPFALIVVGAGIVLGTISGVMYMLLRVPAIVTALGVCMVYETLSNLASISWVTAINGEITTLGRFPYCLIIFAIMFVLFYIIFNYTKFGYNVRACASSQRIAKKFRCQYQENSIPLLCSFIIIPWSCGTFEDFYTGIN